MTQLKTNICNLILFLTILFLNSSCGNSQNKQPDTNIIKNKIDSVLTISQQNKQFNGVVIYADTTGVVINKSYGYTNINKQTPLDEHSIFEIASLSKPFTATLIMRMIELNYFTLESKLIEFFPKLPYKNITIKHLLQHTSGIPDYHDHIVSKYWDRKMQLSNDTLFTLFEKYAPKSIFNPGEKFEYSNTGYYFLAGIAEKASNETYDNLLKKYVLEPAGMQNTKRTLFAQNEPNFAIGHELSIQQSKYVILNEYEYPENLVLTYFMDRKGPGGISSNTIDLWRFSEAIKSNKILNKNSTEQMFTPGVLNDGTKTNYGLGWQVIIGKDKTRYIHHRGGTSGYRSYFMMIPGNGFYAFLTNSQNPYYDSIKSSIENAITGRKIKPIKHSGVEYLKLIYAKKQFKELKHEIDSLRTMKDYYFNLTEFNAMAWSYWLKEDYDNGIKILQLAVVSMPDNAGVLDVLAESYAEVGQNKIAVIHYTKVIDMLNADKDKRDKKWVKEWIEETKTKIDSLNTQTSIDKNR